MSFLDRIAATLTPAASDEQRAEARANAEKLASESFIGIIVGQHKEIESLVHEGLIAQNIEDRKKAVRELERVLTGHSTAEEAVIYPNISEYSGKTHAGMAYEEHAMTKVQLAKLEKLDPSSKEWREKLEHIQGALQQHMYQEEDEWLPDLADNTPSGEKTRMTERFVEEYERYCGEGSVALRSVQ